MRLTKKICFVACFVALFILLDKVSMLIPMINVRITSRNLPLYIGAYIYGPYIGAIIGLIGMIISQFNYAIDLMSILFLLPQTFIGFLTGILAKKKILNFDSEKKNYIVVMIILNVILSLINTVCIFLRYMYYGANINAAFVTSLLEIPLRIVSSVITAFVYAMIMPYIIKLIKTIK